MRLRGRLGPQHTVQCDGRVGAGLHGEAHFPDRPVNKRACGDAALVETAFRLLINGDVEERVHLLVTLDRAAQDGFLRREVIDHRGVRNADSAAKVTQGKAVIASLCNQNHRCREDGFTRRLSYGVGATGLPLGCHIISCCCGHHTYRAPEIHTGSQCTAQSQGLSTFMTSPSMESLMSTVTF